MLMENSEAIAGNFGSVTDPNAGLIMPPSNFTLVNGIPMDYYGQYSMPDQTLYMSNSSAIYPYQPYFYSTYPSVDLVSIPVPVPVPPGGEQTTTYIQAGANTNAPSLPPSSVPLLPQPTQPLPLSGQGHYLNTCNPAPHMGSLEQHNKAFLRGHLSELGHTGGCQGMNSHACHGEHSCCSSRKSPQYAGGAPSARGRNFTFASNQFSSRAPPSSSSRGYHSSVSCCNTPCVSSMDEQTTSGTESCRDCSCGSISFRKPRRRARKKSASGAMNGMSSSESLNHLSEPSNTPADRKAQHHHHQQTQKNAISTIPLRIHKGTVLDLDSEHFPALGSGTVDSGKADTDSTVHQSHVRMGEARQLPDGHSRVSAVDKAVSVASGGGGGWTKSGSMVLQTPFKPIAHVATQTDFGTRLAFLTLLQFSPMFRVCSDPEERKGVPGLSLLPAETLASVDNDSGYCSPKSKSLDLETRSIAVEVAPPIPDSQKRNQQLPTSGAVVKGLGVQPPAAASGAPVQQWRKKKKNAASRKKRGTLTMENSQNMNTAADTGTTSGKEDDDIFSQMDENFPALTTSATSSSGQWKKVTMGAGLQVTSDANEQSATSWKPNQNSQLHQAQLIPHTNTTTAMGVSADHVGVTSQQRTPVAVSTSVSQSVKAKGLNASRPLIELPLTAFIRKDISVSVESHPSNSAEKGLAVSDSELVSSGSPLKGAREISAKTNDMQPQSIRPIKKGKQRETPKSKKPSSLKKVILQEREDRKKVRELYLTYNENPPPVVNQDSVLSMVHTLSDNLGEIYNSCSDVSESFGGGASSASAPLSVNEEGTEDNVDDSCIEVDEEREGEEDESRVTDDNVSGSVFSSGSHISSIPPPSTVPSRSGSAVTLFSLPEFPSGCCTSDSDSFRGHNLTRVKLDVLPKIHSKKFREYCNQVVTKDINAAATDLLRKLHEFQNRALAKVDAAKMKSKRRLIMGLREVKKHLSLDKLKLIVFSPNMEKVSAKGGLDDMLDELISLAREKDTPFVFALSRRELGLAVGRHVPVSCVGVFNFYGAETSFKLLMDLTESAREMYKELVVQHQRELKSDQASLSNVLSSDQKSTASATTGRMSSSHQRSNSYPLQTVTSFSCDEMAMANTSVVAHQPKLPLAHPSTANADICRETSVAGEGIGKTGLESYEVVETSLEESAQTWTTSRQWPLPETASTSLVAHQEIILNISISDAVPSNNTTTSVLE